MMVAVVHSFYSSRQPSGENNAVTNEVSALRRAGHEISLVAARTDEREMLPLHKLRAGFRVATGAGTNPLSQIEDLSPDVVHVHNLFPNYGDRWLEDLHTPFVHTLWNYRPICPAATLYREEHGVCHDCLQGNLLPSLRYRCYRGSVVATAPLAWRAFHDGIGAPPVANAATLIAPSELTKSVFVEQGVDADRVVVEPPFLPHDIDPGRPESGADRAYWLYVGRLSVEKGIIRLLDAWPSEQPLVIVGDGPERGRVRSMADEKGARYIGSAPQREVLRLLRHAKGLIFPSLWYETFGIVYLEALATGTPVLAFRPSTVSYFVETDNSGATIEWSTDLREALEALEAHPPDASRLRDTFEQKYSETAFVKRRSELYRSVMEHAGT